MRKLPLFFLIYLSITQSGYAAPAYGTKLPQKGQFYFGGQTHVVTERELEGDNGEQNSIQHLFLISYGVFDWLSLDLKGGAGNIEQRPEPGDEISYPAFMGGGYGFRLKPYDQEKYKVVFGFQHISIHPYSVDVGETKHKGILDDWQASLLASRDFKNLTPYLGTKWSRMDYIHWVDDERKRVKSAPTKSVGLITGVDILLSENVWLNVEGQFIDVQAFATSLNFHF